MHCQYCNKRISQKDKFCRNCGKEVVVPPPEPPAPPLPGEISIPIENSDFGPGEIRASIESPSGSGWGAHIYTGASKDRLEFKERPEGCPEWVEDRDWASWFRRGLVVWEIGARRIGTLLADEAIALLTKLREGDEWRVVGIPIVERHQNVLLLPEPPRRKTGRKKKGAAPEPEVLTPVEKSKFYEREHLRLAGIAAEEFFSYLKANEAQLRRMVDEEARLREEADRRLFPIRMEFFRLMELQAILKKDTKFPWMRHKSGAMLTCDVPPNKATITLSDSYLFWRPLIERPGGSIQSKERFVTIEKALDWAEKELSRLHSARSNAD